MRPRVPYRILAIDDIPSNLLTLRAILPADEFLFSGVQGAEEAFRLLESEAFDLILLDVLLPGLDGYAIARKLKADPSTSSIPLIFLTSLTEEDEVVKGFETGAVDFVSKPFHRTELLLRLRTHLSLRDKNAALEEAAAELRSANQARDRFFSILAHDLRNPFTGFQSLVQEVLDHYEQVDRAELLEVFQTLGQTAESMARLLETLLDWGRSQTGSLPLDPQVQPLGLLVDEALESVEAGFARKQIRLEVQSGFPLVLADRYTVAAILRNLLTNALKFTTTGGLAQVTWVPLPGAVEVAVTDTGVGIAAHRLGSLFRIDNKASTPGTNREPGSGLGLILCQEFARLNGGTLEVESELGRGSTFRLKLPAPRPEDL